MDRADSARVRRARDVAGTIPFDVEVGHQDRAGEDAVDVVNIEYLDVLIDVTGDQHMGETTIG